MILIDTNVLVALSDDRDRQHQTSITDLGNLSGPYGVIDAVLVEAFFLLREPYLRQRVQFCLQQLRTQHIAVLPERWQRIFSWMDKYTDHKPDLCDAILVNGVEGTIWTYDSEFATTWRRMDGSLVPHIP